MLADAHEVERWVLGGDYAAFGAWPVETVERLRGLDARWIRGNVERWTASPADAPDEVRPALERNRELLGEDLTAELAVLPETLRDGGVLFCHGSPSSDVRSFLPDPGDDEGELLGDLPPGVGRLVFGHTHLAFRREVGSTELVNPGSAGIPLDGDHRASYAVVGEDGAVEHRRVAYDSRASAAAVRERLGEAGELFAGRIERAAP